LAFSADPKYHSLEAGNTTIDMETITNLRHKKVDDVINIALSMQRDIMPILNNEFSPKFGNKLLQIRVGIHTGEVWASILGGSKRFKYELFGPHLSLADRVQQACLPGKLEEMHE
jgi:class 3 adenylate cyclase